MKEMIALIKNKKKESSSQPKDEKKNKRDERRKKFNDALVCKNCGKKHPTKAENECRELNKNKDSCPSNWKSTKSTWRCEGAVVSESWQPGKVSINKLNTDHTYLITKKYWTPLQNIEEEEEEREQSRSK